MQFEWDSLILKIFSGLLILGGLACMMGWWLDIPWLVYFPGDLNSTRFNTAFGFVLVGGALLCNVLNYKRALLVLCVALITIFSLITVQYLAPINFHIDYPYPIPENIIGISSSVRTSFNAALGFILIGLTLIFIQYRSKVWHDWVCLIAILLIYFLGLFAFAGDIFKLQLFFASYNLFLTAGIYTSGILIILSAVLWYVWRKTYGYGALFENHPLVKAGLLDFCVMLLFLVAISVTFFSEIKKEIEIQTKNTLSVDLDHRKNQILHALKRPSQELSAIMQRKPNQTLGYNSTDQMLLLADELRGEGFSAVRFKDAGGKILFATGKFIDLPKIAVDIKNIYRTKLFWYDGFYVEIQRQLDFSDGKSMVVQWPLNKFEEVFDSFLKFSNSSDMLLCKLENNVNAICFPTRLNPYPFTTPLVMASKKIPINYALGESAGTVNSVDYRGIQVLAAYTPLEDWGLGLVLKEDIATVYMALHAQLKVVLLLLFLTLVFGSALINMQIYPLLRRIIHGKNLLQSQKEELEEYTKKLSIANISLQSIMQSSMHAIISTDTHGVIRVFNRAAERMLYYSADEIIDKKTPIIFHDIIEVESYAKVISQQLGRTIDPGFEVFVAKIGQKIADEKEWTYIRKDGSRFPVFLSVTALCDQEGKVFGYVGIAQDISERKKIERMKNEFISVVSHELRTPLTSILGSLSLLLSGVTGALSDKVTHLLTIAQQNSERLARLINDILDIEKIEAGRMEFNPMPIDLALLMQEALNENQGYADQFEVTLAIVQPVPNLEIVVDKDRVLQVFANIISNAIKFSPKKGNVTIRVNLHKSFLRFMVEDQGPGIPEEFQSKIFEKFSQADSTSTRKKSGTGLGLSICKAILTHMGGNIGFITTKNQGTTFYFDLPATLLHEAEYCKVIGNSMENKLHILHVENEIDISQVIGNLLQNKANLDNVTSIKNARHALARKHYDLVILDLHLPDGSAVELIPEIHRKNIPIIVFSAYSLPEEYADKINIYLLKSKTSNEELLQAILSMLKQV